MPRSSGAGAPCRVPCAALRVPNGNPGGPARRDGPHAPRPRRDGPGRSGCLETVSRGCPSTSSTGRGGKRTCAREAAAGVRAACGACACLPACVPMFADGLVLCECEAAQACLPRGGKGRHHAGTMPGACHVADRGRPRASATCLVVWRQGGAHARVVEALDHHHSAPTAWGPRASSSLCGWSAWLTAAGRGGQRGGGKKMKARLR